MPCSNFFFALAVAAALSRLSREATVLTVTFVVPFAIGRSAVRLRRLRKVFVAGVPGDFRVDLLETLAAMALVTQPQ